jgi:adenylate cyclase
MPDTARDAQRISELTSYAVLGTPRELAFDELSELAAEISGCPVAFVNLIDATHGQFKASCGIPGDVPRIPRDDLICNLTIEQNDVLVIRDAAADERYRHLGTVAGEPHVRFYCGAPLISARGYALGTLCTVDFAPREIAYSKVEALRALSHQVMAQLELRRNLIELGRTVKELAAAQAEAEAARVEAEGARARSDELLRNILPGSIARELTEKQRVEPRYYDSVTIGFTDFVGFTRNAGASEPARLLQTLDEFFTAFDAVTASQRLEKLKTIGDSYMFAAGLPDPSRFHALEACLGALEFQNAVAAVNAQRATLRLAPWTMRTGLHSGPVMAGIVGKRKFAYDVWGDTVNVAARMEQAGEPGRVNISEATHHRVKAYFACTPRGAIETKNRGALPMYFLDRLKPEFSANEAGTAANDRLRREIGLPVLAG